MALAEGRLAGRAVIDAHVHLFPDRLFEAIWRWFERGFWDVKYRLHAPAVSRFLDQHGVSHHVGLLYAHKPGMARSLNQFMAALAADEPRLVPCGTVLPGEPGARAIVDHALGELGLRGLKLHCHVQCLAPDDPRLDEVYDAAAAHSAPIVIHAGDGPASPHYGCEVAALCTPEALARALSRHPRTTVIVPHLGFTRMEEVAALLEHHPNLHLDTTMALARYFPSTDPRFRHTDEAQADRWLERAAAVVARHADRVLYGSDFPNIPYDWDRELKNLAALGLAPAALDAVLAGNARRLFGVAPSD